MMNSDKRRVKDINLIRDYLKQHCNEFKLYQKDDDRFFTSLHYGCKAKLHPKNSLIPIDLQVIRIVYSGTVYDAESNK